MAVLIAVGVGPTLALAGNEGISALLVGCLIALMGAWAGSAVAIWGMDRSAQLLAGLVMAGMMIRLLATGAMALAAKLLFDGPIAAMLIWVGVAHLALLIVDTRMLIRGLRTTGPLEEVAG